MLKKGKEITVFLALTLILSGCGGEKEKSRSEVKAAAAVSVQSTRETVKYTETINTEILTEAAVTEILCGETENVQPIDNNDEFNDFKDNVVVIGDSIALGYGAYERLPMKHVFAKLNASPSKMDDFKFEYAGESR